MEHDLCIERSPLSYLDPVCHLKINNELDKIALDTKTSAKQRAIAIQIKAALTTLSASVAPVAPVFAMIAAGTTAVNGVKQIGSSVSKGSKKVWSKVKKIF
jgi:hypothetical protein